MHLSHVVDLLAAKTQPAFEGLHPNTNVGRGPTKGNGGKPNKRASGAPR